MKFTRLGSIFFCVLLQAILVFNAHSHSSQFTHPQDSDYFVRPIQDSDYFVHPIKETTGLVYSGRYHYPKHLDNWKWVSLGTYSVRYRGKILIYRYCSEYVQHRGHPQHHRSASGRRRVTLESWRIDTHSSFLRPLCSCYRCVALSGFKKLNFQSGSIHYVIYYSGHAEIHKDEKTERVKPKTSVKPKPKMKQLEQHSRKRSRTKNAQAEPRNRKEERRRPRCGISSHNQ